MPRQRSTLILLPLLPAVALAQTPQHVVVPAVHTNTDAISYGWIAGASRDVRQQTLVGPSHLQALLGHELLALELRRTAADETYQGGTAHLTVVLSTSPNEPLRTDPIYFGNVGADAAQVFSGPVTLPTSPPDTGPNVPWSPQNIVRIPFTAPFLYRGGTLCIDVVGQPIAGQNANWWMADAEFEDIQGSSLQIGSGCGAYGGAQHVWSFASDRTLLPGAHARFWAYGPPNGFALAAFGAPAANPIPLQALGLPAPGCTMQLHPNLLLATTVALFEPEIDPRLWSHGGSAEARIWIPNAPWVFGLTLATQWLDLAQPATSNAIQWTVANSMPTLDMALVEGHPNDTRGEVTVHFAHVWRFEYR